MSRSVSAAAGARRSRRAALLASAALVFAVDLVAKEWAEVSLRDTVIAAGPVNLRLAFNPGVAFSVGAGAPTAVVIAVTAVICAGVAVFAWRGAPAGSRLWRLALAGVLGGAVGNLADRSGDGVVTDYLQAGWWPTFNLADTAIITGALLLVLDSARGGSGRSKAAPSPEPAVGHRADAAPGPDPT